MGEWFHAAGLLRVARCWPCRSPWSPAWSRSSRRAWSRCCRATSPTRPGCPAPTSPPVRRAAARPDAAPGRCCSCSASPSSSSPRRRCRARSGRWSAGVRARDHGRARGRSRSCSGWPSPGWCRGCSATWRVHKVPAVGLAAAPLLGVLFGLGWAPCIGPTLAAIRTLVLQRGHRRPGRAALASSTASGSGCRSSSPAWPTAGCSARSRGYAATSCGSPGSAA